MSDDPMSTTDLMARSGAAWCEDHDRWECSKNSKRTQVRCHDVAIRGTDSCRTHAGKSTQLAKAQGEANLLTWSLLSSEHEEAGQLDPADIVLRSLRVSVMRADFYAARLRELAGDDADALVGPTYAAGRDGMRVEIGEQRRALTRLEAEERDRAVRFAKTAHDMGVDTRRLELEQVQASIVVTAAGAGLEAQVALVRAVVTDPSLATRLVEEMRDVFLSAFLGAIGRPADLDAAASTVVGEVEA